MSEFLGEDAKKWTRSVRSRDPGWFDLAESVNDFCHDLLLSLSPYKTDARQVISSILFKRALSAFQAIVSLGERGMHTEVLIQRRGMLESLFTLVAMWHQPRIITNYLQNDEHRRRDIYKNLKKSSKKSRLRLTKWLSEVELDSLIQQLEASTKGIPYTTVKTITQAAKLYD